MDKILSRAITILRFPLIVGVVFAHNKMEHFTIQGQIVDFNIWPWVSFIMYLIRSVIAATSVPLFFIISGFLLFNNKFFNTETYKKNVQKRCHSLLIPYIIWNFVGFVILLIQVHPYFNNMFPLLKDYRIDISTLIDSFWVIQLPQNPAGTTNPINYPLWFLRDLMVLVLLAPIIYKLIKLLRYWILPFICALYFFRLGGYVGLSGLSHQSVVFFLLGSYLAIENVDIVRFLSRCKFTIPLYAFVSVADVVTRNYNGNEYLHMGGVILGVICFSSIAILVSKKIPNCDRNQFLSKSSFFIYLVHGLFITKLMKLLVILLKPTSPFLVLALFFAVPIITIILCLLIYHFLNKNLPAITNVLVGGR